MTERGYTRRIAFIESVADGYYLSGKKSEDACRSMMDYCTECVNADYYGVERPTTQDAWIYEMAAYFDGLFATNPHEIYSYA